jgi:hypothetical protein
MGPERPSTQIEFSVEADRDRAATAACHAPTEVVITLEVQVYIGLAGGPDERAWPSIEIKRTRQKFDRQSSTRKSTRTQSDSGHALEGQREASLSSRPCRTIQM